MGMSAVESCVKIGLEEAGVMLNSIVDQWEAEFSY